MYQEIRFNKIIVIESLRSNDVKTGTSLYHDVIKRRVEQYFDHLSTELVIVNSKQEFFSALNKIYLEMPRQGVAPYLHFEIRGDQKGLQMNNGEVVTWQELYPFLLQINVVIRNNLFVTLATCYGAHILDMIVPMERVSFFAYVGPPDAVFTYEIEKDWNAYFDTLLTTKDFTQAIETLNKDYSDVKYMYMSSEMFWDSAMQQFLLPFKDRKERRKRLSNLTKQAKSNPEISTKYTHEQMVSFAKTKYKGHRTQLID